MADNDSRAGKRYADASILGWLDQLHGPHDPALETAFHTPAGKGMPAIMVSPADGRTLEILLRLIRAEKIVEVGTLAGYSALRMAAAMPPSGRIWSIEYNPEYADIARANIAQAGLSERVHVLLGAGVEVLPTIEDNGPFDAMFVDADKGSYDRYGAWAAEHLRPGGLLLGDNAYLFGRLLEDSDEAAAMRRFHEQAAEHFHSVCVPTPDGLLVGIKK